MPKEKRSFGIDFLRLNVKTPASLKTLSPPLIDHKCFCTNLSAKGVRLYLRNLDKSIDLGTDVAVSFFMPDGVKEIHAIAEIVWIKKEFDQARLPRQFELGIRFTKIELRDARIIKDYIFEKRKKEVG